MKQYARGWQDLKDSVLEWRKTWFLTRFDLKLRYRRTFLGPYWIILTTLVSIMALGFVFGVMFQHNQEHYFAYVASGIMIWQFITTSILGSADVFTAKVEMIRNLPVPLLSFVFRMIAYNSLIFIHSLAVYVLFVFYEKIPIYLTFHWFLLGCIILVLNLTWISALVGMLCTRFRDLIPLLGTIMSLMFIVTPIFWVKQALISRQYLIKLNPFVHLIEIVRDPMLGKPPQMLSLALCVAMLVAGSVCTFILFAKKRDRLVFWI